MTFADDAFATRMWKLRLHCDDISTRLKFKNVGEVLHSTAILLATMKGHASQLQCPPMTLQLRKEVLRLQELLEDIVFDESESTHVEVCCFTKTK